MLEDDGYQINLTSAAVEVRLVGLPAVGHLAATIDQAVEGAVDQMVSLFETILGKLGN